MGDKVTLNTLEELVSWITANHYWADRKWKLQSYFRQEWDDAEEGAAWDAKLAELEKEFPRFSDRTPEYYDRRTALHDVAPDKHGVYDWTLVEAGEGWHAKYIELSRELGAMIEAVWTKRPARYGSGEDLVGNLTIPGMLKRLGNTEVGQRIKAQKELEQRRAEKNSRNYARRELRKLAMEMEKHLESLGMSKYSQVHNLAELEDEA